MPNAPLVTVVMPCCNAEKFVAAAIDSVVSQTYPNIELLIVDDGSSDGTHAIASSRLRDGVRILSHPGNENRGVSCSRKLGVDEAKGRYVAFLDADDAFAATKIQMQIETLGANPNSVLCHTGIRQINDMPTDRDFEGWFNFSSETLIYDLSRMEIFLKSNRICNSSVLIRTEIVKGLSFYAEQIFQFEDWVMWTLASERGNFIFLPEPLTYYRFHERSATNAVIHSRLRMLYSHVEYYLAVINGTNSSGTKQKCLSLLADRITELMSEYGTSLSCEIRLGVKSHL